jgi:uncharacterized damage-inducible protein DinB
VSDLRYPIGPFGGHEGTFTPERRTALIAEIADLPGQLRAAVTGLSEAQFNTPYRPGGWTVRQVVHHVPDSHLNAYVRCKLALTEDNPTIKPYDEARWAELPDTRETQIGVSLVLLEATHRRWVILLRSLQDGQWFRTFVHPEYPEPRSMDWLLAMYAWHGKHHTAQITSLRQREGWT